MFTRILSGSISGCEPFLVEVEIDFSGGLPGFTLVGLPDAAVGEARERVRAAIKNAGFEIPPRRITVNLAPADIRKEGTGLDVPLAIAILTAAGIIPESKVTGLLFVGEVSLDGSLRHTPGVLPLSILAMEKQLAGIVVPALNAREAQVIPELSVYSFATLGALVEALRSETPMTITPVLASGVEPPCTVPTPPDLSEIKGQHVARRALEIAAAGGHCLLLSGVPGSGKTLLARAFPTILPRLSYEEAVEVTRLYSIKGLLPPDAGLLKVPPFRDPHHTISDVALIGGGRNPAPGEVSLAHRGVLFLDELPEFRKSVLEVLREPLTEGGVTIARAAETVRLPARFVLLAAMNPCPCGYLGDPFKACVCSPRQVGAYQQKISGPLLDRIDLQVPVGRLKTEELASASDGETSAVVRERVLSARERQKSRFSSEATRLNAHMSSRQMKKYASIDPASTEVLLRAVCKFGLSARAYDKIIRVARTIADLAGEPRITLPHVTEAIQYRTLNPFGSNA